MYPGGTGNFPPPSRPNSALGRRPRSSSITPSTIPNVNALPLPSYRPALPSAGHQYQQQALSTSQPAPNFYGYQSDYTTARRSSIPSYSAGGYPASSFPPGGSGYLAPQAGSAYQYAGSSNPGGGYYPAQYSSGEDQFASSLSVALSQQQSAASFQQFSHYLPEPDPPEVDFEGDEESAEAKNRPKTPPDQCAVCGVTHTTEWRKGPAGIRSLCNACGLNAAKRAKDRKARGFTQPSTIDQFKMELMAIGAERFKSVDGTWTLPPNTTERIYATIERTEKAKALLALPKATKKTKLQEKKAAEALVFMSRGGQSTSTRPPQVTRRSSVSTTAPLSGAPFQRAAPYPTRGGVRPTRGSSISAEYVGNMPSPQSPTFGLPPIGGLSISRPSSPSIREQGFPTGGKLYGFPSSSTQSFAHERLSAALRSATPPPIFGAASTDSRAPRSRSVSMTRLSRPSSPAGRFPQPPPGPIF